MAYSSINAAEDGEDDSVFSSGGAIMDALNGNDPSSQEEKKATKTKTNNKNKMSVKAKSSKVNIKKEKVKLDLDFSTLENKHTEEKELSNTRRNSFIDGVLDVNLSQDGYGRIKKKRKLNSYE